MVLQYITAKLYCTSLMDVLFSLIIGIMIVIHDSLYVKFQKFYLLYVLCSYLFRVRNIIMLLMFSIFCWIISLCSSLYFYTSLKLLVVIHTVPLKMYSTSHIDTVRIGFKVVQFHVRVWVCIFTVSGFPCLWILVIRACLGDL